MAENDPIESWLEKHVRPVLPGWTRYRSWLMSPVEDDLVRVFEVVVYCTRTTFKAWVAPVCVPWEARINLRRFFATDVPGAWAWHRPQDVPKVRKAIQRYLPKFEPTRTLEQWVATNKKHLAGGGIEVGTIEEIALPLIALGEHERADKLLDRAMTMIQKFKPLNEEQARAVQPLHERIATLHATLADDPSAGQRKLATFRRQNMKRYGLKNGTAARAGR